MHERDLVSSSSASVTPADASVSLIGEATESSIVRCVSVATFLFARIHHFAHWCEAIGPDAAGSFVPLVRQVLTDPVLKLGGEVAQRRPDCMLAVFCHRAEDAKPNHAQRGLHAAILAVHECVQLARSLAARTCGSSPSPLTMTVGVHLGVAELSRRKNAMPGKVFATGDAVDVTRALETAASRLHWSVAATSGTHVASAGRVERGASDLLPLSSGGAAEIVEITGLVPRKGSSTPESVFDALRLALAENKSGQEPHAYAAQPPQRQQPR
jgi:class 3 adenylate cyclase